MNALELVPKPFLGAIELEILGPPASAANLGNK